MTLSQRQVFELCDLFAALHDGALSDAEVRAAEGLLREDRDVCRLYVRYMRVCAAWHGTSAAVGRTRNQAINRPPTVLPARRSTGRHRPMPLFCRLPRMAATCPTLRRQRHLWKAVPFWDS